MRCVGATLQEIRPVWCRQCSHQESLQRQAPLLQKMVTIWPVCGGGPEGQGLALPGNDCLRYLVTPRAQGLGRGRRCLQLVFKGQEIPSGKMTSC